MTEIASRLEQLGYTLRSGGAQGADLAFEAGVKEPKNKNIYYARHATTKSLEIAKRIHPAWDKCKPYWQKLHARNCFMILGLDLKTPSQFVICWTPNGADVGGTRTGIVLARENKIPVYNLESPGSVGLLDEFLYTLKTGIR
jgi:hypothetical protein